MEIRKNSYFISILALHAETYFLFGVLEKSMRTRITSTLSFYSRQKGYEEWIRLVPNSLKGDAALRRALKENMYLVDGLEEFLPFSFWRSDGFQRVAFLACYTKPRWVYKAIPASLSAST